MQLNECAQYLRQNQAQILDLTERLVAINSGSFNLSGLHRVNDLLRQEFASLECEQTVMPVAPFEHINDKGNLEEFELGAVLRCWKRPNAKRQVLLIGHMDTVFPHDHKFQHVSKTGGDILHGPGVADMKGGLAIMLWGLKAFEQLPEAQDLGWELILNADEEIGSPGSQEIIEQTAKKHSVGLVFEPAMDDTGTLAGQRKGGGKFTLVMRGKAAHSGRHFAEGRNAICKMAEIIGKINTLNGQREGVTINVGIIRGGEAVNIVADCCVCHIDVRIPTNEDGLWVTDKFNEITKSVDAQTGYKLELHGGFGRKPKILDEKMLRLYELVKNVGASIGQTITWQPSGGCCDGNILAAMGIPNVDTLGPRGGKIHSEQEYIFIPSLVERAHLLTGILSHLSIHGL
jgi:glutamate carboxypeptidase